MGPNAQYYQRHRKTARNYTTVTRFENVIFRVMGDNFQHFLLVHMLLQTRELHNWRPWALLFYVTVILINIYNLSTGWYPHATQFHCGYNFVVLSMFPEIRWSVFTRVIFSDSSGIHAERFWQSLISSSIFSTRHLVVYDPIWFSRYMKLWIHIWCCWPYHSPVHQ